MQTISLRIDSNLKDVIEILAESEDRTLSDFIKNAVKDYIRKNKNIEDYIPSIQERLILKNAEKEIVNKKTSRYNPKDFE